MNWTLLNRLAVGVLAIVPLTLPATAADPKSDGLAALQKQDFKQAYELLLGAVEDAKNKKDDKETADLLFYLGLCRQQAAQQLTGEAAAGFLAEAAMYYNQALGLTSKTGSLLNNLAQVYIQQSKPELAKATLLKAISLADANQAFHMENYADLLVASGDWKEGSRFYALALWAQPDNTAISRKLANLCLEKDPELLAFYLWDMTKRGQVLQGQEIALTALKNSRVQAAQKQELLAIVAACLSQQKYDALEFEKTDAAKRLLDLSEDASVAQGGKELVQLHKPVTGNPPRFDWWREKAQRSPPARGLWPLQAFQGLSRSIGNAYKTEGKNEYADYYLRLAVELNRMFPDLQSLISLVDLYARTNRLDALRDLMRKNEDTLFGAKSLAYQEGKLNEIYQFHRALGSIYSYLKKWGSSSEPTSAIFQLEHALETARLAERRPEEKNIEVEPALVERLATGYTEIKQPTKAVALRLDTIEQFQKAGRTDAARELLAPMQEKPIPSEFESRFNTLKEKLDRQSDSAGIERTKLEQFNVRVSPKSQSFDEREQPVPLSKQEMSDIQKSINDLLNKPNQPQKETKTIQIILPKEAPGHVKEIEVEGAHGKVLLKKDTRTVEVPFTIDLPPSAKAPSKRYVQP
jgi:Tfp pilus assembly protein PilF